MRTYNYLQTTIIILFACMHTTHTDDTDQAWRRLFVKQVKKKAVQSAVTAKAVKLVLPRQ